jgi:lipopolysaccharide export system ATP-binding protein
MSVLRAEKLTKSYNQRTVVNKVDVEVHSGEIIALLGRNGAGKTTTFQMIVGLVRPEGGKIFLDEKNISKFPTYRRAEVGITYLPQEDSVFLKATVANNLRLVLELLPYTKKERTDIADSLLDDLGLRELSNQEAYKLSGGERRKLEISRSLLLKPKFLLLDEPFTGIDPLTIIDLQKIMLSLKKREIGIVLSDHNVRDTFKITDRAYIIDEGDILTMGSPEEVAANKLARERFLGKEFKLGREIQPSPGRKDDLPESPPGKDEKEKDS